MTSLKAVVVWLNNNAVSVVNVEDIPEEDRKPGVVSRVRWGRQSFPARVEKITVDSEEAERLADSLCESIEESEKDQILKTKRTKKPKKESNCASEAEILTAMGSNNKSSTLDAKNLNKKKVINKKGRSEHSRKVAAQLKVDEDLLTSASLLASATRVLNFEKNEESTGIVNEPSTASLSEPSAAADGGKEALPPELLSDEQGSDSETSLDGHDLFSLDGGNINENELKEILSDPNFKEVGNEDVFPLDKSESPNIDVLEKSDCSNALKLTCKCESCYFVKTHSSSSNLSMLKDLVKLFEKSPTGTYGDDSAPKKHYVKVKPLSSDEKPYRLTKSSSENAVVISQAAKLRIVNAGVTVKNSKGKKSSSSSSKDKLKPAKAMVRQLMIEMFTPSDLHHLTAYGTGKSGKGIEKHVLDAMFSFVVRHCADDGKLTWPQFVDTINRKGSQMERSRKIKEKMSSEKDCDKSAGGASSAVLLNDSLCEKSPVSAHPQVAAQSPASAHPQVAAQSPACAKSPAKATKRNAVAAVGSPFKVQKMDNITTPGALITSTPKKSDSSVPPVMGSTTPFKVRQADGLAASITSSNTHQNFCVSTNIEPGNSTTGSTTPFKVAPGTAINEAPASNHPPAPAPCVPSATSSHYQYSHPPPVSHQYAGYPHPPPQGYAPPRMGPNENYYQNYHYQPNNSGHSQYPYPYHSYGYHH